MSKQRSARTYLTRTLFVFAVLSIAVYALFEMRHLLRGPVISIEYPENGATVEEALVEVRASTKNVSHLSLNDRPIYVDSKGNLREPLLLSNGYNIIRILAKDRFGRATEEELEIMVESSTSSPSTHFPSSS